LLQKRKFWPTSAPANWRNTGRRRTRGIEESRALMWELTDTSGVRLINPESMARVWEVQQNHVPCIQDPPGVELYTQVGSGLQKGSTVLDVLRCGRGSVESFHQNTFIPGWRSNATHMLEGNMQLYIQRVLGCALLPEFIPTGERIAVEYLLAQSDRGDLLGPQQDGELGTIVPDRQVEEAEEECLDITSSDAVQILSQRPAVHHLTHHLSRWYYPPKVMQLRAHLESPSEEPTWRAHLESPPGEPTGEPTWRAHLESHLESPPEEPPEAPEEPTWRAHLKSPSGEPTWRAHLKSPPGEPI
ncbi:hypothetical protein KUCAC02_023578, partial [Chaenocephalus aceratus]